MVDPVAPEYGWSIKSGKFNKCVAATALLIKADLGVLQRTEANHMMVTRIASKLLTVRNVRKSEIARMLPMIAMMVFLPTREEILVQEMMGSDKARVELQKIGATYKSGGGMVGWARRFWNGNPVAMTYSK